MPRIPTPSFRIPRPGVLSVVLSLSAALLIGAVSAVALAPSDPEITLPQTAPSTVVITKPPTTTAAPTTTTTTTIVPVALDPTLPCQQWLPLALEVGWPNDEKILTMLLRVMNRESRCRPEARSKTSDTGLLQANDFWCEPSRYNKHPVGWLGARMDLASCEELKDPRKNLQAGLLIWYYSLTRNGNGWHPWRYSGPTS